MNRHLQNQGDRPQSDVQQSVGVIGLMTLAACIVFAREWPLVAGYFNEVFGWRLRAEPLSGPMASLTSVIVLASTMSVWSIVKYKVHRNDSTGINWAVKRAYSQTFDISIVKLAGLWCTWALVAVILTCARWLWQGSGLFALEVLALAAIPIFVLSVPYVIWLDRYLIEPKDGSWHFGAFLVGRGEFEFAQIHEHFRSWAIKAFFITFMISILPSGWNQVVNTNFSESDLGPIALGQFLIALLFLVDVQIGTVGYLLTFRPLDAHIRSANPFLAGWLAAFLCYPPLNGSGLLAYEEHTVGWIGITEGQPFWQWIWASTLVFLTAVYAWATMAFGIRFSNLTYRGLITNGPYRWAKHPAYLSKNLFWWIATIPFIVSSGSVHEAVRNTVLLMMVSGVYFWRAKTEEAHLAREDERYLVYAHWMRRNVSVTRILDILLSRFKAHRGAGHPNVDTARAATTDEVEGCPPSAPMAQI